jgi:hypothetical protein
MKKDIVETIKKVRIRPMETSFEINLREDVSLPNN